MKKIFRCELTVNDPKEFLEQCGIQKDKNNPAELKRVNWIWDKRPRQNPYVKWVVYVSMITLMIVSGQAHSICFSLASAVVGILALEVLDRIRRKRLSHWSQDYGNSINRLLASAGEDNTYGGKGA
jgi:hypothetical protein